jgi:hypothetical protein
MPDVRHSYADVCLTYTDVCRQLDRIATGEAAKEAYLAEYYLGPNGLRDKVKMSEEKILPEEARSL